MAAKLKWEESQGSPPGVNGGWDFKNDIADFSGVNVAGAATVRAIMLAVPFSTALAALGAYDPYSSLPALAAATAARAAGTGASAVGTWVRLWQMARASAGGPYTPGAGSTIQVDIVSANETGTESHVTTNVFPATAIGAPANIWSVMTMAAAPAERQVTRPDGTIVTGFLLFPGDFVIATLVTTGALNVQSNNLAYTIEWV